MTTQKCLQAQLNEQESFEIKGLGVISKDSNISRISDIRLICFTNRIFQIQSGFKIFLFDLDPFFLGSD